MNLLARLLFVVLLLLFFMRSKSQISSPSEICNNAIDDDQDGLIDLNDEDCYCPILVVPSLIPNPSFEDQDCCPSTHSSLHCATGLVQASAGTTDYFHNCGWIGANIEFIPQPLPDGDGVIGFYDGSFDIDIINPNWKEYVGACLIDTLIADSFYILQFDIGFLDIKSSPPINMTIFGTTDCSNLPFGGGDLTFGCPSNGPGWTRLGSVEAKGDSEWKQYEIILNPKSDITAIALGPDCPPRSLSKSPYYFLDNLTLAKPEGFDMDIFANDHPCADNLTFEIQYQDDFSYQWYKNGVAIIGVIKDISGKLL